MQTVIVLFNLRSGVSHATYEEWARQVDLPTVNRLPSVAKFETFKALGLLSGEVSPFQYVEVIRVRDSEQFLRDLTTPEIQGLASKFQQFADNPLFIASDPI